MFKVRFNKQIKYALGLFKYKRGKIDSIKFHTSAYLKIRTFRDTENVYAYNILQSMPTFPKDLYAYTEPTLTNLTETEFNKILDQNWRSKSAVEITDCFKRVVSYCIENDIDVSDKRFDKLVDGLMDRVQDLSDVNLSDLLTCLRKLPSCDSYTSHNFHDMWSALDDVCCWRATNWSTDTLFLFADHWYRLNLGRFCNYLVRFVERMVRKSESLTRAHLVQLFFYINVCRKHYVDFSFESIIEKYVSQLSADEMAIIAMGFFKSQTRIRVKPILCAMMDQLKAEMASAHEITITAILKVLRYSSHAFIVDQLMDLLDHLVPEIDRLSNVCYIHAALLGTTLQFFHAESLEKIVRKIHAQITDVEAVRLKDMERLMLALTMFDFDPEPSIFQSIYEEIHNDHRRKEFVKYPRSLPSVLNFLSLRNIYSDNLMNEVLDKDHILENYGKHAKNLPRDLFSLDICIEVERPGYVGNRLDSSFHRKVAKWNVEYTPTWNQTKKLTTSDRFMLDVVDAVAKVVNGHRNLLTEHVLPNYVKSDIIVCKDSSGRFQQPCGFDRYVLGDVMRPTRPDWRWFSVVPVNWNACIRNTTKPLGLVQMKVRQLRAIGYAPVIVIWNEFLPLNEKERLEYLKNKIL